MKEWKQHNQKLPHLYKAGKRQIKKYVEFSGTALTLNDTLTTTELLFMWTIEGKIFFAKYSRDTVKNQSCTLQMYGVKLVNERTLNSEQAHKTSSAQNIELRKEKTKTHDDFNHI